jgi:hypothetical protein
MRRPAPPQHYEHRRRPRLNHLADEVHAPPPLGQHQKIPQDLLHLRSPLCCAHTLHVGLHIRIQARMLRNLIGNHLMLPRGLQQRALAQPRKNIRVTAQHPSILSRVEIRCDRRRWPESIQLGISFISKNSTNSHHRTCHKLVIIRRRCH